jgi:hypothetical protein
VQSRRAAQRQRWSQETDRIAPVLKLFAHFLASLLFGIVSVPFWLWAFHPYESLSAIVKSTNLEFVFAGILGLVIALVIFWRLRHGSNLVDESKTFLESMVSGED